MLSRFGVWLLVGVCNEPARCESAERLGRLVSMTLSWIETASTLRRDYVGELLKRLTSQYVCRWLTQVRDSKLDVLCACLSPNPAGYVKVGGCWDSVSSKVHQHMEGLHRLCCLVPHNLVTPEVSVKLDLINSFDLKNKPENKIFPEMQVIAHFRITACLSFKASPGAQPFKWNMSCVFLCK